MHRQALLVLGPLQVALAWLALTNPAAPIFSTLLASVGGLMAFVTWAEKIISRWDD